MGQQRLRAPEAERYSERGGHVHAGCPSSGRGKAGQFSAVRQLLPCQMVGYRP